MAKVNERVQFRIYHMPCCGTEFCWINGRKPTFCPVCGKQVYEQIRRDEPGVVLFMTETAWLKYEDGR